MSINTLPQSTIRLITTSQIITSVSTAVKELMENAIDAEATIIQINLMNQGLDLIEVKDNGTGISIQDVPLICQAATTSKITDIIDLDSLSSYGFRGEALNALCQVGDITVTTKTSSDAVASMYKISHQGEVINSQPSHFPNGTTISIRNLFHNLPVRKQYLSSKGRMSEELRKVERVVKGLALIHCKLRVTLTHNQCVIWQKNQTWSLRLSLSQVIPINIVNNLDEIQYESSVHGAKVHLLLPKKSVSDISALCLSNMQHAYYIYVNKRPVRIGKIEKMLSKEFSECFRSLIPHNKHAVCLVSIEVPSNAVDVNLEPNKTKVLLKDVDELLACIRSKISDYYYDPAESNTKQLKSNNPNQLKANITNQLKPGVKRKQPECSNEEESPRKVCKAVDMNNQTEVNNDGGFMNVTETTLSQLPSLLESKENLIDSNFLMHSDRTLDRIDYGSKTIDDSNSGNVNSFDESSGFLDRTMDNSYNSNADSIDRNNVYIDEVVDNSYNNNSSNINETSTSNLPVLHNLEDIIPYDSYTENATSVKEQQDSAYHSEENKLESSFSLEIYEKSMDDISATQWSKGNVVIKNKALDEPTYVYVKNGRHEINRVTEDERRSCDTSSLQKYVLKTEANQCQEGSDISSTNEQDPSKNSTTNTVEDNCLIDNTMYFQTVNQELSLDQSDLTVPGTPAESQRLENFTTFAKEIRRDILENKPGISFSQVASQMVNKSNSLYDSVDKNDKKKSMKLTGKPKETSVNKSMLEFVSKKLVRNYPAEETVRLNFHEVKSKLLEKSRPRSVVDPNLSSEESEVDDIDEVEHKPNINNLPGIESNSAYLHERWNYLMETIQNQTEEFEDTMNPELPAKDNTVLSQSSDSSYIHSILLKKYRFRIIGSHDKNYFYMCKKSLGVLNVEHLYKLVTYYKHLRTFQVPSIDLEDCILLDNNFLHIVLSIDLRVRKCNTSDQNITIVKSEDRLLSVNGVGLMLRKNHSKNEISVLLCQKPKDIPAFGSKDATELVYLASLNKPVEATRPLKIQRLIQNQTEEHCAAFPLRYSDEAVTELMAYWFEHIRGARCPLLYERKVMFELYAFPQTL